MFMLTGGEPLVRKADVLKLSAEAATASSTSSPTRRSWTSRSVQKSEELGNIVFGHVARVPEPSVNDSRRGEGSFRKVMDAFDLMHKHGLPYGTSTCYAPTPSA